MTVLVTPTSCCAPGMFGRSRTIADTTSHATSHTAFLVLTLHPSPTYCQWLELCMKLCTPKHIFACACALVLLYLQSHLSQLRAELDDRLSQRTRQDEDIARLQAQVRDYRTK